MPVNGKPLMEIIFKKMSFIALCSMLLFIAALHGCNEPEQQNTAVRDSLKAARDSVNARNKSNIVRTEFQGLYNYEMSGSTFRDCAYPDSVYLISDATGKLKSGFLQIFPAKNVYGSIVAKVKGELVPTSEQKFQDKYSRTLKVTEVILTEKKNPKNTCIPYDFWAFGNEPSWQLQISKKEGIIDLHDAAEGKNYSFFWNEPKAERDTIVYGSFNTIRKYSIDIRISKGECKDPMSGEIFDYSVTAEITGGKKFRGCARKGQ